MDSAKRLEQAVGNLENIMKNNIDFSPANQKSGERLSQLSCENKALKEKQNQVKLRLDTLIKTVGAQ